MIIQIVGGPDDGKELKVSDGLRTIKFALHTNVGGFVEETKPDTVFDKTIILPIKLTRNGYRVYWPGSI